MALLNYTIIMPLLHFKMLFTNKYRKNYFLSEILGVCRKSKRLIET